MSRLNLTMTIPLPKDNTARLDRHWRVDDLLMSKLRKCTRDAETREKHVSALSSGKLNLHIFLLKVGRNMCQDIDESVIRKNSSCKVLQRMPMRELQANCPHKKNSPPSGAAIENHRKKFLQVRPGHHPSDYARCMKRITCLFQRMNVVIVR